MNVEQEMLRLFRIRSVALMPKEVPTLERFLVTTIAPLQ